MRLLGGAEAAPPLRHTPMKPSLSPVREMLSAFANPLKTAAIVASLSIAGAQGASSAVIPYTNDFSGTGSNTAFPNENLDANWAVSGGSYVFNNSSTSVGPSSASIQLTNVGNAFTIETQFSVGSSSFSTNANGITLGMGVLGSDANFTGTSAATSYYLVDWLIAAPTAPGTLRIVSLPDNGGFNASNTSVDDNSSSSSLAVNLNSTYTMRLDGVYSGSTLVMTLSLYNASGAQIGASATATDTSPLAGTYFGYRNRMGLSGGSLNANFDNFSVTAVPEPGTVTMLALGAGVVLYGLRRRKTA